MLPKRPFPNCLCGEESSLNFEKFGPDKGKHFFFCGKKKCNFHQFLTLENSPLIISSPPKQTNFSTQKKSLGARIGFEKDFLDLVEFRGSKIGNASRYIIPPFCEEHQEYGSRKRTKSGSVQNKEYIACNLSDFNNEKTNNKKQSKKCFFFWSEAYDSNPKATTTFQRLFFLRFQMISRNKMRISVPRSMRQEYIVKVIDEIRKRQEKDEKKENGEEEKEKEKEETETKELKEENENFNEIDVNIRYYNELMNTFKFMMENSIAPIIVQGIPKSIMNLIQNYNKSSSNEDSFTKDLDWSKLPQRLVSSLRPFQKSGIAYGILRQKGRIMLCDEMGLGKTIQAIGISCFFKEKWPVLVICPSSLRVNWSNEFQKWINGEFDFEDEDDQEEDDENHEEVSQELEKSQNDEDNDENFGKKMKSKKKKDLSWCVKDGEELNQSDINIIMKGSQALTGWIVISSYDIISRNAKKYKDANFKCVILDEAHYIKNEKSQRTQAAEPLISGADIAILLTGTPALSRPIEIISQVSPLFLNNQFISGNVFKNRYCGVIYDSFFHPDFKGASNLPELNCLLESTVMLRRLKKDHLKDLPDKVRNVIRVEISKEWRKQLKKRDVERARQRGEDLDDSTNEEIMKTQQRNANFDIKKCHYMAGMGKVEVVKEMVKNFLEDTEEEKGKIVVFGFHMKVMDDLESGFTNKNFSKKSKFKIIRIDGNTKTNERAPRINEFQTQPNTRVALLSIKACGTGFTLTASSNVIFAELSWTPGELQQAEDRVHRIGQKCDVKISYVIGKRTLDEAMWQMIVNKLDILSETLDMNKINKINAKQEWQNKTKEIKNENGDVKMMEKEQIEEEKEEKNKQKENDDFIDEDVKIFDAPRKYEEIKIVQEEKNVSDEKKKRMKNTFFTQKKITDYQNFKTQHSDISQRFQFWKNPSQQNNSLLVKRNSPFFSKNENSSPEFTKIQKSF